MVGDSSILVSLVVALLQSLAVSATTCYWRDGNATLEGYTPCNSSGASACCLVGGGETCTSLGICNSTIGLQVEACTDPTWKSPACSPLCPGILTFRLPRTEKGSNFMQNSQQEGVR